MIQGNDTLGEGIARSRNKLPTVRPEILLYLVGLIADAATTVYGFSIMGMVAEAGLVATVLIPALWKQTALGVTEAAAIYAALYIAVGVGVAATLHHLDQSFSNLPAEHSFTHVFGTQVNPVLSWGYRQFTRTLALVFVASPAINVIAIARWIAYQPGAGWVA